MTRYRAPQYSAVYRSPYSATPLDPDARQTPRHLLQLPTEGEIPPDRIEHVQRVSALVHCPLLRYGEGASGGEGTFLEKEADLIARVEEVPVANVRFFALRLGRGDKGG